MKYDVFISYSRQDYVDEHEVVKADSPVKAILDFLDAHQISYWFDKEGIYSGSEFVEVIANAIADSKMMLFVSSEHSNESIYTAGEIFEAIENNQLIIPIKIDGSKYNKKFKLLLNPLDYIDFSKNDALTDLLKAVENEKARIAKIEADEALRREELKKREWKKSVKHEIQEQANELQKLKETRNALLASIYKKLRSIDITKKQCPVCESKVDIEVDYCQACGWFFPSLSEIEGMDIEVDKSVLILAQSRWESNSMRTSKETDMTLENMQKGINNLKGYNAKLKEKIKFLEEELENRSVNRKLIPKSIHAIYIGLLVLLMGGVIFASFAYMKSQSIIESQVEEKNELNYSYLEAMGRLDRVNTILSATSTHVPFIITDIEVNSKGGKVDGVLDSKTLTYIRPKFHYIGLKEGAYMIDYKVFYKDSLIRGKIKDYSTSGICSLKTTSFDFCELPGFGYNDANFWAPGNYRIEIWWNNKKLAEKEFVVK